MKKTILAILLSFVYFLCFAQKTENVTLDSQKTKSKLVDQFSIRPARVFFNLSRGESGTNKIFVANHTADTLQLRLSFSDWLRDTIGAHTYYEPEKLARSCARWITLDKTFLEINPKETKEVHIRMDVPDSAEAVKEMKWTMLFVETREETKAPKKENLKMYNKSRIGVHIYQTSPSLTNGEIRILNFCALPGSKQEYRVICQNVGNIQYDARSYIEMTPLTEEGEKITIKPVNFPIFPEQTRYVTFTIPESVPKGKYNAVAIVDGGTDSPVEAAQAIIEVK